LGTSSNGTGISYQVGGFGWLEDSSSRRGGRGGAGSGRGTPYFFFLLLTGLELFRRSMWAWLRLEREQLKKDDAKYKDHEKYYLYPGIISTGSALCPQESGNLPPAFFSRTNAEIQLRLQMIRDKMERLHELIRVEQKKTLEVDEETKDGGDYGGEDGGLLPASSISSSRQAHGEGMGKGRDDDDDDKDGEKALESGRLMQKRAASRRTAVIEGSIILAVLSTLTILAGQKWL